MNNTDLKDSNASKTIWDATNQYVPHGSLQIEVADDTSPQLGGDLDANAKAIVAADHGTAATDQVVNVCYGTGTAPTANTTTIGTLFVKYTA